MKKIICDRCGKEMESIIYEGMCPSKPLTGLNYRITSYAGVAKFNARTYDLCDDCQHELDVWLKLKDDKRRKNNV